MVYHGMITTAEFRVPADAGDIAGAWRALDEDLSGYITLQDVAVSLKASDLLEGCFGDLQHYVGQLWAAMGLGIELYGDTGLLSQVSIQVFKCCFSICFGCAAGFQCF